MVILQRCEFQSTYVYFNIFYGQSVVPCFLYTVYLTLKSPHLPLHLHQCFPTQSKIFPYRGGGGLYACKNRASMSKQRRGIRFDQCLGKHVSLMEREWSCY